MKHTFAFYAGRYFFRMDDTVIISECLNGNFYCDEEYLEIIELPAGWYEVPEEQMPEFLKTEDEKGQ